MDMIPRTPWLRSAWQRARRAHGQRQRPASPSEVLAYVYFVDATLEFLKSIPLTEHKRSCPCSLNSPAVQVYAPVRKTAGAETLYYAERSLYRNVQRYTGHDLDLDHIVLTD